MTQKIPSPIVRAIRNRRGLLWVCQRHDLEPGQNPHDNSVPPAEAILRYRKEVSAVDESLASIFWEAVWLEGIASPLHRILLEVSNSGSDVHRPVVTLADASDAAADVTSEFLPVCVLPGVINQTAPKGSRYGATKRRARDRIAWDMASRLAKYPGRALVVLGPRRPEDLELLVEVLEDSPIRDLHVLIVYGDHARPVLLDNPAIDVVVWEGTEKDLCGALSKIGAPAAEAPPTLAIRCGNQVLSLAPRDVQKIDRRYALITENDLTQSQQFTMEDLHAFLSGDISTWVAFAHRIPVERRYRTKHGRSLPEEVCYQLAQVAESADSARTFVIRVPSDPGAGITTLLRTAAFRAAEEGFPSLVLRPEQVQVDQDELIAFATTVNEVGQRSDLNPPPLLIVFDVEHEHIAEIRQIANALATHGRRALILQAISSSSATDHASLESWSKRSAMLLPLTAEATTEEVKRCRERFSDLSSTWLLPLAIPTYSDWISYSKAMLEVRTPGGREPTKSLFWIALRFFLVEGMDLTDSERALDALGRWIERRIKEIPDTIQETVRYVAVFSSFRLASPLWTVLRPATGGSFDSSITAGMRQLEGIVVWGANSAELDDQTLRFTHPALAMEFLRRHSARKASERLRMADPVIRALSAGHRGDIWLAETLAADVITPTYEERNPSTDYDWRLEFFDTIPPLVRDQSKAILHHWGRCLYLSVDSHRFPDLQTKVRHSRYKKAIQILKRTLTLPRRPGREEHPSHLYNTLGTAFARYARFLDDQGDLLASNEAWKEACEAFRSSIRSAPNVEALLAFAHRLITRAQTSQELPEEASHPQTEFVADALSYLDEAEELLKDHPNPDPNWETDLYHKKLEALDWLNSTTGRNYLEQLKADGHAAIATYCEARLALGHGGESEQITAALAILDSAESAGVSPTSRLLLLHLSLMRQKHPECFDFPRQLAGYRRLEAQVDFVPRPTDQFRHAILCYQNGDYEEGKNRFRKLRELARREGGFQFFGRDVWRDRNDPSKPRVTQIRMRRFITEWRAEGYVEELGQDIPLRPRHFAPMPKVRDPVACAIRFEPNGPLAVPPRFVEQS